ncbi:glycosyl hydrolase 115 family protein [Aestuariibaculum sediminum]|uniref:Glycosyl hydrolase 115 family protein n=1 Tax=Aestuariibaculum sediminum TaxID=2770637 RepID=A0A8J6UGK7_9FLAO|nr:glycosyl hydrolase 115 family protein [Aestuariibaculum sediminum]MBD0832201.1 glycosyl hydrolase 115 family protein [Aestuariibaculum sediminum]
MNRIFKACCVLLSTITLGYSQSKNEFPVVKLEHNATIIIDKKDAKVVDIAAKILINDVYQVSGVKLQLSARNSPYVIVAGTIGSHKLLNKWIKEGKLDSSPVENKWETFSIQVLNNPSKDIQKALVVLGSDRRATAYGLLELSRKVGVSPWEWWADVKPDKQAEIILKQEPIIYGEPSVKYRGIFLNDEDWGLQRWAALNYEPEIGDIGPKTYAKIFELLLRLRANTFWPAMHKCTQAFYSYPKNKETADNYAMVVGSSHAEPMLCNINAEWNHKTMGEYRYDTNSENVKNLFRERARQTADYESIYTVGMRGEHDSPMIVGEDDTQSQVKLLEQVIFDQREILRSNSEQKTVKPQAFVPYKEVLKYYKKGLKLPDDITLVWTDDNYGYIRQLSNPSEQKRGGGAGVYYHTSYWGRPHDYLWLNSTNPVLMWEEMFKAYDFNSREIWILNCGDIKPHEYNIELFLDMAWDITNFKNSQDVKKHRFNWATREFGLKHAQQITNLMIEYDNLAFKRRPEFMAWSQVEPVTKAKPTELTHIFYGDEVTKRIAAYQQLIDSVEVLKNDIAVNKQDAFYQLIYYPVIGAASLNHKWLYAYRNEFSASQGRFSAKYYAEKSKEAYNRIILETKYFNQDLKQGKWKNIMNSAPRNLPVFSLPSMKFPNRNDKLSLGIALEGYEMELNNNTINSFADVLPIFNAYTKNSYFIDVFLKKEGTLKWEAKPKADWISLSKTSGVLNSDKPEERLLVSIDWEKVPKGEDKKEAPLGHDFQLIPPSFKVNSAIEFITNDENYSVGVSVFNPKFSELKDYKGFVEDKGYVVINAENYTKKQNGLDATYEIIEGLGYTGASVVALPRRVSPQVLKTDILSKSPVLMYDFYIFNFGEVSINIQAVPTHAQFEGRGVRCAVSVDDAPPEIIDFETIGRSADWKDNVLKNAAVQTAKQILDRPGKHTLKVWMVDPGVLIDQILIDLGGWKSSYAFPEETKI